MNIVELTGKRIVTGDGAMGTMIQAAGADPGELPESLNISNPELIRDIHLKYFLAGSDYVSTNTFGANRLKLNPKGYSVRDVIVAAVGNARDAIAQFYALDQNASGQSKSDAISAANPTGIPSTDASGRESGAFSAADHLEVLPLSASGQSKYVALSLGPVGKLMEPMGDLGFEEAYDIFKEQALAGEAAGADFILLETFTDIFEIKTAVLAITENCALPVLCSVTFQDDGRMLTGTDPVTAVHILQDMGIVAIGVNCSLGPGQMVPIVKEMLRHAHIPVLVQPNAGLPQESGGETVYEVDTEEFTSAMGELIEAGVSIVGGCCGTSPDYIRELKDYLDGNGREIRKPWDSAETVPTVCSPVKTVFLDDRVRVIGERLNPTGKKLLKQALIDKDYDYIEDEAMLQVRAGAELLEVNMGLPDIEEEELLLGCIRRLENNLSTPLVVDCTNGATVERAMRLSRGKPMINSVNGEAGKMAEIFPIVKKYGAAVIALTLDEKGIPDSVEGRLDILDKMISEAASYGIGRDRLIVDCLTLTVSAQQDSCVQTLEALRLVKEKYGMRTTLGVSNISFGLPERGVMNRTFLSMALLVGLDAPIMDPVNAAYMDAVKSAEVLLGKDRDAEDYIGYIKGRGPEQRQVSQPLSTTVPVSGTGAGDGNSATGAGSGVATTGDGRSALASGNGITTSALNGKRDGNSVENPGSGASTTNPGSGGAGAALGITLIKPAVPEKSLDEIIRGGFESRAAAAAEKLILAATPMEIIENVVMPALESVGRDYETGDIFLPQMIKSADAAKSAFEVLRRVMMERGESVSYGRVILATVKDDIHDIGKNIVKAIMENYGYDIIDLGKDVPPELIVKTAREEKIKMVGLSALMTTTVVNMARTIDMLKSEGLDCVTAVGGAVLNAGYARKIGADKYCAGAMDAVYLANEIFRK
ncbi:hypothetical protein FACS1894127_4320 [Clostridia bacterium]|nr:hypothetical protein FACS1894127_4320 [Clostridia bacterium]